MGRFGGGRGRGGDGEGGRGVARRPNMNGPGPIISNPRTVSFRICRRQFRTNRTARTQDNKNVGRKPVTRRRER